MTDRLAYSVREAAEAIGVSKRTVYRLIDAGQLRSVHVLGRRVIPAEALTQLLAGDGQQVRDDN